MSSPKKTLVLGASTNPERYSHLAIQKLRANDHPVVAIGKRPGQVGDVDIQTAEFPIPELDTVTLYLNPKHQQDYYDYILSLKPKRVVFNPGAENPELASLAKDAGIVAQNACTLVLLSTSQY